MHEMPTGRLLPRQLQMLPCYVREASYNRKREILLKRSVFPLVERESFPLCGQSYPSVLPSKIELEIMLTPANVKESHGFYLCPTQILKYSPHIISAPLATLINNSVQRGIFPSKLNHAKIIPIFKDRDKAEPGNYRAISLLLVFNRFFEKIMYNHLKSFFSKHCLFYKSQYDFRKQRSTKHKFINYPITASVV